MFTKRSWLNLPLRRVFAAPLSKSKSRSRSGITFETIKSILLVALFSMNCFGQSPKPVTVLEGGAATLSFTLPDTKQVNDASIIFIKLDPQDGTQFEDFMNVLFLGLKQSSIKVSVPYQQKLKSKLTGRRLEITLSNVNASDFGYFRCYTSSSESGIIPNCGQELALQGKDNPNGQPLSNTEDTKPSTVSDNPGQEAQAETKDVSDNGSGEKEPEKKINHTSAGTGDKKNRMSFSGPLTYNLATLLILLATTYVATMDVSYL